MRWLFVIDHLDSLNKETDTTVAVMKAARSKGIAVFWTTIEDISWEKELSASVTSFPEGKEGVEKTVNFTLIFMRKEPPYDLRFHYATELLSHAGTRVVNDPQALRDENEKLIILNFPELLPSTLVTSSRKEAEAFLSQHHSIVVKDLESYQGKGIVKATNRGELEEAFSAFGKPVMLQQFLPKVIEGDTRNPPPRRKTPLSSDEDSSRRKFSQQLWKRRKGCSIYFNPGNRENYLHCWTLARR
jgi:glutathione synthase